MSASQTNRAHRRFGFLWAFVDFLTTVNVFLIVVNVLIFLMINPETQEKEGIVKNAEYVMLMRWPLEVDCDVDIWVRNPNGNIIYFAGRDLDHMNIERDDMGTTTDTTIVNGVPVPDTENAEYVTLRTFYEGIYVVNIHLYSCRDENSRNVGVGNTVEPFNVNLEIIKINPRFNTVFKEDIEFSTVWEEKTAVRFKLNKDGNYVYVDNLYEKLVSTKKGNP